MPSSLHTLFESLLVSWLDTGAAPDAAVEGVTPEFAALLGTQPADFTFDDLAHAAPAPEWTWLSLEIPQYFDGPFAFYVPRAWAELSQESAWAWLHEGGEQRQSIVLLDELFWKPYARAIVERGRVLAFSYASLLRPSYHQWIFVLAHDASGGAVAHAAYSAGEWFVSVEGAPASGAALRTQLTALVNSNPWYGWIDAARAQRE
jgi:hypothetical protein